MAAFNLAAYLPRLRHRPPLATAEGAGSSVHFVSNCKCHTRRKQPEQESQRETVEHTLGKQRFQTAAISLRLIRALVWICETNRSGMHQAN
jgi:hypothetical protein